MCFPISSCSHCFLHLECPSSNLYCSRHVCPSRPSSRTNSTKLLLSTLQEVISPSSELPQHVLSDSSPYLPRPRVLCVQIMPPRCVSSPNKASSQWISGRNWGSPQQLLHYFTSYYVCSTSESYPSGAWSSSKTPSTTICFVNLQPRHGNG